MEHRYEIVERIATGGMAEIYRARVHGAGGFEKPVVVKKILPAYTRDEEFVEMFIEEAKLAGTLQHGNIVQVYDLGVADGDYFIVMEYVQGRDLGDLMHYAGQRDVDIDLRSAIYIVQQVCSGLDYAHRKLGPDNEPLGIIHRDVSPQNVILSYEGEVKLTDLGIAKAKNRVARTQVGFLKGKYGYMSPEQARAQPLDHRSDIFNVGILLFELLVGERLFLGSSDFSTLNLMRNATITPLSRVRAGLPDELESIVMKALAASPAERFQTAGEMERALSRFSFQRSLMATAADIAKLMERVFGRPRKEVEGLKGTRVIALSALPSNRGARQESSRQATVALGPVTPSPPRTPTPPQPPPPPRPPPPPEPEEELETDPDPVSVGLEAAVDAKPPPRRPSTLLFRTAPGKAHALATRRMGGSSLAVITASYLACVLLPFGTVAYAFWPDTEGATDVLRDAESERVRSHGEGSSRSRGAAPPHAPEALLLVDANVPDAAVWVDGVRADGRTPLSLPVAVGADLALEISAPGHHKWTGRATVARGERVARVTATLEPKTTEMRVSSRPRGATVHVDGLRTGHSPMRTGELPRGNVHVKLEASGYAPWEGEVDLQHGTNRLHVDLVPERRAGRLEIVSRTLPVRARIDGLPALYLDERASITVAPGRRTLRLTSACGAARTYRVDVAPGQRVRLFVDLFGETSG